VSTFSIKARDNYIYIADTGQVVLTRRKDRATKYEWGKDNPEIKLKFFDAIVGSECSVVRNET
jgi:hypothetical protein